MSEPSQDWYDAQAVRAERDALRDALAALTDAIHDQAAAGHPVSPRVQIAYTSARALIPQGEEAR